MYMYISCMQLLKSFSPKLAYNFVLGGVISFGQLHAT